MKKLIYFLVIVFVGLQLQGQDRIVMNSGDVYDGKITAQNEKYVQITINGESKFFPLSDIDQILKELKFSWDEVIEQQGTKDELFTAAKMAMADVFNSVTDVTQNSDEETGLIQIKAQMSNTFPRNMGMITTTYYYKYSLTLMFKDNRFRIKLGDVTPGHATTTATNTNVAPCPPLDPPITNGYNGKYWVNKKQYQKMRETFSVELKLIYLAVIMAMEDSSEQLDSDW